MDPRLAKFSLDTAQLAALEAAIQCVIGLDAFECLEKKDERGAATRLSVLVERADRSGRLHIDGTVRTSEDLKVALRRVCPDLRSQIIHGFSGSSRLHATLAMIEVLTVQPYTGSDETRKFSVSDEARNSVAEFVATAVNFDARSPSETVKIVRAALEEANGVFSQLWKRVGIFVLAAVATGVTGIFAGPFIGGLIGTYLLGLSGAAAVSAGLALLGGGALAAGGFGMMGGTVVIAAAFGAVGAGASQAFLGKDGAVVAQVATIRHLAAFDAILRLEQLDHQLADDFREALERQKVGYDNIAKSDGKDRKEAAKVVSVLEKAIEWINDCYAKAVREKRINREPRAWSEPKPQKAEAIKDRDFAALSDAIQQRRRTLEHCLTFLRNAHHTYADVKDADFMVALLKHISGSARQRLVAGHELLQCVLAEIMTLVHAIGRELEQLTAIINKVAKTSDEISKRDAMIERYERINRDLYLEMRRAAAENDALRTQVEDMDRALARASLVASLYRASRAIKILAEKNEAKAAHDASVQADPSDHRHTAKLDLAIAMLVEANEHQPSEWAERARELGIDINRTELMEAIDALELPLGTPSESVHVRYRERFAEVHPDRHTSASGAMERMLQAQRARLSLARDVHLRYLAMRGAAGAT